MLSVNVLTFSDSRRDHSFRKLQSQYFANSLTMCRVWLLRDAIILLDNLPVQHDQRLAKIAGRSHHEMIRLKLVVHDTLHSFQLMTRST